MTEEARKRFAALGEIAAEVAHELRNVLQIISSSAYVARLEVDKGDPSAARPHLVKVENNAHAAHAIVDDILSLARGDALAKEEAAAPWLLQAARSDLAPEAAHWQDVIDPPGFPLRVHVRLFARLLRTLYENAILEGAPARPTIVTRVGALGAERVVIEVADDGPGVPASIAAQAFEPLVTARRGGTGLGLALARRIAAAHGGSIALVATPQRGATFRVELPK
jgi:signal transduction histidine kinase